MTEPWPLFVRVVSSVSQNHRWYSFCKCYGLMIHHFSLSWKTWTFPHPHLCYKNPNFMRAKSIERGRIWSNAYFHAFCFRSWIMWGHVCTPFHMYTCTFLFTLCHTWESSVNLRTVCVDLACIVCACVQGSSWATPWPTPTLWSSGRLSLVTFPTLPSASLTSSSPAVKPSGCDRAALSCCFPMATRAW